MLLKYLPGSSLTGKKSSYVRVFFFGCVFPFVLNSRMMLFFSRFRIHSGIWKVWEATAFGFFLAANLALNQNRRLF